MIRNGYHFRNIIDILFINFLFTTFIYYFSLRPFICYFSLHFCYKDSKFIDVKYKNVKLVIIYHIVETNENIIPIHINVDNHK
jgi:hypothetical protein